MMLRCAYLLEGMGKDGPMGGAAKFNEKDGHCLGSRVIHFSTPTWHILSLFSNLKRISP
jgi:hypothetical protein